MEVCVGCGAQADMHPIVGIVKAPATRNWYGKLVAEEHMASVPVCDACWKEPSHRKVPIKAHFFPRHMAAQAEAISDALLFKSRRGENLGL